MFDSDALAMESRLTSCCYLILQALALVTSSRDDPNCVLHCPLQNRTHDILYEVGCGPDCQISQCLRGCSLWEQALEASCQAVCNGTQELLPPKELYCVMGCNDALDRYLQSLKEELGTPNPPALVADSLTSTSLRLEWKRSAFPSELTAVVQWSLAPDQMDIYDTAVAAATTTSTDDQFPAVQKQAESLKMPEQPPVSWQYARNQSWDPLTEQVSVWGLRPYTNYRFRVTLVIQEKELSSSSPSVAIGTLPGGKPSSPPSHLRATVTDSSRVSVSWRPGSAPNGPILSYVLAVGEVPHGYKAHKDIPASDKKEFYTFQGLLPSRNYTVSVSMRNAIGLGPPASVFVTTPPLSQVKDDEKIILILGAHHAVISQAADMVDEPVVMYRSQHKIRGVAVHVRKGILFISDSLGRILVTPSRGGGGQRRSEAKVLLAPEHLGHVSPHSLSIDWLNDQLYILGQVRKRWQVARCELDGSQMTVAIAGLLEKPLHMEVDPYNGYLFWVMEGIPKGGLYRLDMADISNGVKHEVTPDLILHDSDLGAFTVDHANFRILVPSHSKNTVLAVSLDGKEITDLRHNTQKPQFSRVLSLTMANGLFYWTNGERILAEEYHNGQDSYFHNLLITDMIDPGYVSIGVDLPSAQPVPSPVNPPTGLQAIMGTDHIRASWNVPHLLGGQGKGAWQNWSYDVRVEHGDNGTIVTQANGVRGTASVVTGLRPSQLYAIRVAAATSAGVGPWSARFIGRTLSTDAGPAVLVWATSEGGVVSSDATGHSLTTFVHRDLIKEWRESAVYILDLAWYKDVLFLVTNNSASNGGAFVMSYNTTSKVHRRLSHLDHQAVGSIAVDWVGRRLYWANPKQQLITRGTLSGSDQEPLPMLTVAKELNIDSELGFIYWSTGHAVECSRLNGRQKRTYYPAELFSGKQVMGLTLDTNSRVVYWIVRNYEGSVLFNAHMADGTPRKELILNKVVLAHYTDVQGPLIYFDQRLYWVRDAGQAVVGDLTGLNSALLTSPSLDGITAMTVISTRRIPGEGPGFVPHAIPSAVDPRTIKVIGDSVSFNITWDPVESVNIGTVFYEMTVSADNGIEAMAEVVTPSWPYPSSETLPPYTKMEISLRALTYWGGSPAVTTILHSPQAAPSEPTRSRVFVNILDKTVEVILRWNPPAQSNGILIGYNVVCWLSGSDTFLFNARDVPLDKLSFTTRDIPFNTTAFFQVRACTISGCGPPTRAVPARTDRQNPIPLILASTTTSIVLVDDDRGANVSIVRFTTATSFSSVDFRPRPSGGTHVYWIDDGAQTLYRSSSPAESPLKVLSLNGSSTSGLAVDWVSDSLFWIEIDSKNSEASLKKLQLGSFDRFGIASFPVTIYSSTLIMRSVQVNPLTDSIYWYEDRLDKPATLWIATTEGQDRRPFFGSTRRRKRTCDCPESPHPGPVFTLDHLSGVILWVDVHSKRLMASDFDACTCNTLVDFSRQPLGYPVSSLTSDHDTIYWSAAEDRRIFKVSKRDLKKYASASISFSDENQAIGSLTAFGRHLRPWPESLCLTKRNAVAQPPVVVGRSSHSLKLKFHPTEPAETTGRCSSMSRPAPVFVLYYQTADSNCSVDLTACIQMETTERDVEITRLMPYTQYVLILDETNEFAELAGSDIQHSNPVVALTAPGAPSVVENMTADVLNPTTLEVRWTPPSRLNSEGVTYEVHWSTGDGTVMGGTRQRGDQRVSGDPDAGEEAGIRTRIFRLTPGARYLIWVRAFSEGSSDYSESDQIEAVMFPYPRNLTLLSATAYSLDLSWHRNADLPYITHEVEYADGSTGDWGLLFPVNSTLSTEEKNNVTWEISLYSMNNLKPKTVYTFRLKIFYKDPEMPFYWPQDNRFSFKTSGDRPSAPGPPVVHHLGSGKGEAQLVWEASRDNGSPVRYELEAMTEDVFRAVADENDFETNKTYWIVLYENSENYWVVNGLDSKEQYRFRVRGQNEYGWSDYAYSNGPLDTTALAVVSTTQKGQTTLVVLLWVLTPAAVALTLLLFTCVLYRHERTKKWAQTVNGATNPGGLAHAHKGPDVELASLRQIPRWSAHVQSSNVLYSAGTLAPVSLLPHLRRDQITLTKFLGSGAFGEVFEGLAKSLPDSHNETTKVAVKTLRKGANENEKTEFLKEAQLMSNFKHAHILQLLGVCLDNDPHFIIMELMEGGDLLSYLRASRPFVGSETALNLNDLVSMCVDVGRGCCYLEEMHFVHRDLACRNCLVSSRSREDRIVKIGDFGLARDIYKNDYYRKEGEGLLPVRWMSPESLVDGVFTSQSDVWAFGVLLWEIMSLGQQPYPARNNLEVLHYVRIGGRLGQPVNSDSQMYELMTKCWSFNPDDRPTFKYCLQVLEEILNSTPEDAPLAGGPLLNGALRRSGRSQDDNQPNQHSGEASSSSFPPGSPPKYLELVYDSSSASSFTTPDLLRLPQTSDVVADTAGGYEIPRSLEIVSPCSDSVPSLEEATRLLPPQSVNDSYSDMSR